VRRRKILEIIRTIPDQQRNTSSRMGALHINIGITNEPYIRSRRNPARRKRHVDRVNLWFIPVSVSRTHELAEIAIPAEGLRLGSQEPPGFIADYAEIDTAVGKRLQQRLRPRQGFQVVEVMAAEMVVEDVPGIGPAVSEDPG